MKKIFSYITLVISLLILSSCSFQKKTDLTIDRTISTNFTSLSNEFSISNQVVELEYFSNDANPFIEVEDFINMNNGVYHSNEFEFKYNLNILEISYNVDFGNDKLTEYKIVLDFEKDLITIDNMDFFDYYIVYGETDYSEGIIDLPSIINPGKSINYNLNKYQIDLVIKGDKYLIPLHLANLIFNQSIYYDVYYNGDELFGIDTGNADDALIKKILKSSQNKKMMHQSVSTFSYNFFGFVLEYFYGLKNERELSSDPVMFKEYQGGFVPIKTTETIFNMIEKLDDLHTSHMSRGFYNNPQRRIGFQSKHKGPHTNSFNKQIYKVQRQAKDYFGLDRNNYIQFKEYELFNGGKTLVIYLLEFDIDTPNIVEELLIANPQAEDVIIDVTYNTGGNLGSVLRMFALMTNENIYYHSMNPLTEATYTYGVKGDKEAYTDFNYYIKQSGVTFSAANLTSSIAKSLGIPVLGHKSSGGASAIGFFVFPDGSITIMSSNMVLCKYVDGVYESIENGIMSNYYLTDLYSIGEISQVLNEIKKNS